MEIPIDPVPEAASLLSPSRATPDAVYIWNRGMSRPPNRRGPDRKPRSMSPASLANLSSEWTIPAVQDGKDSVATRIRLSPGDARRWKRMSVEERSTLVEIALRLRESGG